MILAAGYGSRLEGSHQSLPKPLVPIRSTPALLRSLRQLALAGCSRAVVVTGHRAAEIEEEIASWRQGLDLSVETVRNPDYHLMNGISLLAARELLSPVFVLAMADHVIGEEVMRLVPGHVPPDGGATLLVDRRIGDVFDLADATKVKTERDHVLEIGKDLADFDAVDIGLFVATHGLLDAIAAVREERGDASLSDGVARLARAGRMASLDIGDGFWRDVDTAEMRAEAEAALAEREA